MPYKVTFQRYVFENDVELATTYNLGATGTFNLGDSGFRLGEGSILVLQSDGKWAVGGAYDSVNTDNNYITADNAVAFVWPGPRVDKTGALYSETGDPVVNYDIIKTNSRVKVIMPPCIIEYDSSLIVGTPSTGGILYVSVVEPTAGVGYGEYRFTTAAPTNVTNPLKAVVVGVSGNYVQVYVK